MNNIAKKGKKIMCHTPIAREHHRFAVRRELWILTLLLFIGFTAPAYGQQFNSDNWWVLPKGVGMGVATIGQEYSTMYLGVGFVPKWEADIAITAYSEDDTSVAHYSTTAFVKRLLYQNEAVTEGVAVMAGIGQSPSYYQAGIKADKFKSYWATAPITLSFADNMYSWDIMPGVMYNKQYGPNDNVWGFSYSTRLAIYKIIPESSIVAEVFGAEGDAKADAQYKAGVRWESKYVIAAFTYGDGLEGNEGAGFEFGVMVITPPYL